MKTSGCCSSEVNRHQLSFMISFVLFVGLKLVAAVPPSCDDIIRYERDKNKDVLAFLNMPRPKEPKDLLMKLKLHLPLDVQKRKAEVELWGKGQDDNHMHYKVYLPSVDQCPGRIIEVVFENETMCENATKNWTSPCSSLIYIFPIVTKFVVTYVYEPSRPKIGTPHPNESTSVQGREEPTSTDSIVTKPYPHSDVCGMFANINHLVFNGRTVTARSAFPWLVAIFKKTSSDLVFTCGGSLISKKHVITAGHCLRPNNKILHPDELVLMLGRKDLQSWENDGALFVEPERVIMHPDFNKTSADADIALIVFPQEIAFSAYVKPVCLWTGNNSLQNVIGQKGIVVGWGTDEYGRVLNFLPKQVALPIVDRDTCVASNRVFRDITSARTFCAVFQRAINVVVRGRLCGRVWRMRRQFPSLIGDGLVDTTFNMRTRIIVVEDDFVLFSRSFRLDCSTEAVKLSQDIETTPVLATGTAEEDS